MADLKELNPKDKADETFCYITIPISHREFIDLLMMDMAIKIKQETLNISFHPAEIESFPDTIIALFKKTFEEIFKVGKDGLPKTIQ